MCTSPIIIQVFVVQTLRSVPHAHSSSRKSIGNKQHPFLIFIEVICCKGNFYSV